MTSGRSLLLIADIGGYTDYMRAHRMSLAHAEVNTARLLETVIDAAPGFELIEIEGDAAFLLRQSDGLDEDATVQATLEVAMAMHQAFHVERQYVASYLCPCDGCVQVDNLRLKFVAHLGEVATQTIRDRKKVVGIDVILVHRLLKNPVEVPEYVLLTDELYRTTDGPLPGPAHEFSHEVEGIGPVSAYFLDVADLADLVAARPPQPDPSFVERFGRTLAIAGAGMPYMLGLKRRRRGAAPVS